MPKAIETVHRLISLALGTTNEEEARTAAVQALRLMRRHGFVVVEANSMETIFDQVMREVTPSRRRWNDSGPIPRARRREAPDDPSPSNGDNIISARSSGFCCVCGDVYSRGERVVWLPDKRQLCHRECYARARAGRGQ